MMSSGVGGAAGMAMLALVLTSLIAVSARPNQGLFVDDMRRPVYRGKQRTRESKSDTTEVIVKSDISVVPDDRVMGRATVATPTLGEALKMVTKQLLQDPTATDMVATDVRTPPRVKNRLEGEAIPLVEVPDTSTPQTLSKVTTNGGLSTWILLNNGEQSTAIPYTKSTALPQSQAKKAGNTPRPTAIIEKVIKKGNESKIEKLSASISSPLVATKKPDRSTTKQPLFDSKFKSRTPVIVGRLPSQKNKTETSHKKVPTTQIPVTSIDVVTKKKLSGSKQTVYIPEAIPTTSLLLESSTLEAPEVPTTASDPSTTTKRPRRPSTKTKKKKNKIRTRPTKQPASQDKIDTDVAETKIETLNRPLSTRIYNYLAREVMPNVGVGLVGLVLTAGLAGLLLYPFGGVVTRRNYDKVAPTPDSHTSYYYDSYSPHAGEISNVNVEDNSYTMPSNQQNSYVAPVYEGQKYNNHYRYEVQDYANENVNGYAGIKDYSTLPDSVKNTQYSTIPENSNYYNMEPMVPLSPQYKDPQYKDPQYKDPQFKDPQYKDPQYKDPQYKDPQYKDIDEQIKYENKYPSLTEYTAYTSASAVGTSGTYEKSGNNYENSGMNYEKPVISYDNSAADYDRSEIVYDKSPTYHANSNSNKNKTSKADSGDLEKAESSADKQPHYSALSSKPTYGNSEFVGSVSVSGSYGAELGHMTGMLPSTDLGPRNIKLNRKKRNANDLANEIDSDDTIIKDSSTQKEETTTILSETTTIKSSQPTNEQNPIKFTLNDPIMNELSNEIFDTEKHDESTPKPSDPEKTTSEQPNNLKQNLTKNETEGMTPVPDEEFGFMSILKRLLQLKLKVGINFIKSTSDTFQRYVAGVTQRMETAVLKLNERSYSSSSMNEIHRRRRDTAKRPHSKHNSKHKKHQ